MKKTKREYPIVCKSCGGLGMIKNSEMDYTPNSTIFILCPACDGTKTVIITEEITDNE